jgi:hypothetical protein
MNGTQLTRQRVVNYLESDWQNYISSFEKLSDEQRLAVLQQQGFSSLHDLLAHICGWWEECLRVVSSILGNEEEPEQEYDIDRFNAESIVRFSNWKEDDLIAHFENLRNGLLDLVFDLPDGPLENDRIAFWMDACVVNHFHEHRFS